MKFGSLSPLKYNIMGPFAFVPCMECRHSVWSMLHDVKGEVRIKGKEYSFQNNYGYWEGDCGRSFPKKYAWTQSFIPQGSLMLSVAEIPFAGLSFTGIIGCVLWKNKEYRIATYLGARTKKLSGGAIIVVQGNMELEVRMLTTKSSSLKAPVKGDMSRIIHEKVSCPVTIHSRSTHMRIRRRFAAPVSLLTELRMLIGVE